MNLIRPATPGFLVTLTATVLLIVVVFSVPYFKSVYFLKASLASSGVNGSITFGTLGYCLDIAGNSTCTSPSIGYELDVNKLLGVDLPKGIEIPNVVVKWITYALVLHVVALGFAAISAAFGLLAHVREMSMSCFSTCISGFGATVALLAFIFDLVLFFVAKARINKVEGGSAEIGTGIWLTLAAWVLLFFSGCFYGLGRCCVRRRPKQSKDWERNDKAWDTSSNKFPTTPGEEENRLAAIKAEADRKALQRRQEGGLPAFHEYSPVERQEMVPLTGRVEGDAVYVDEAPSVPYRDAHPPPPAGGRDFVGGYAPAAPGGRTIDEYNSPPRRQGSAGATYPPQPQRQASGHSQSPSAYPQAGYAATAAAPVAAVAAGAAAGQYLSAPMQQPQHTGAYGHGRDNTTFHSAAAHTQEPTSHSYAPPQQQSYYADPSGFNAETYNNTGFMVPTTTPSYAPYSQQPPNEPSSQYYTPGSEPNSYYGAPVAPPMPPAGAHAPPERSYTLGGNGYGDNVLPPLQAPSPPQAAYAGYGSSSAYSPPAGPPSHNPTSPIRGPRALGQSVDERPPEYDGPVAGGWNAQQKR